ncbi:hypothetical protein NQZ68_025804, partial [Dissostichus eleginoides]
GGLREVDGSSSSVVVLLLVPGCPGSSSSSIAWPQGVAPAPLDEEPIPLGPRLEAPWRADSRWPHASGETTTMWLPWPPPHLSPSL